MPRRSSSPSRPPTTPAPTATSDVPSVVGFGIGRPTVSPLSPLSFELLLLLFTLVSMSLQNLHLYRAVFWLPHSYNDQAIHWQLVDGRLLLLTALILGRRLLWQLLRLLILLVCQEISASVKRALHIVLSTLVVVLFVTLSLTTTKFSGTSSVGVGNQQQGGHQGLLHLLALVYPLCVYGFLFGVCPSSFLELEPSSSSASHSIFSLGLSSGVRLFRDTNGCFHSTTSLSGHLHPETIRFEVELMKNDFNQRLKQALFNASSTAYYATFIPPAFATSHLEYDTLLIFRHILSCWIGSFTLYSLHLFSPSYLHLLHQTASVLGSWMPVEGRVAPSFYGQWSDESFSTKGTIVRHKCGVYRAEGISNVAEPGNTGQIRFFVFFKDVSLVSWMLLGLQLVLVTSQHLALLCSSQWHTMLSDVILLFANFYALFIAARDYLEILRLLTDCHAAMPGVAGTSRGYSCETDMNQN